jgi:hypothetical protein
MIVQRDPRRRGVRLVAHKRPVVGVDEAVRRAEHDRRSHDRLGHARVANVHGKSGAIRDPSRRRNHELLAVAGVGRRLVVHVNAFDRKLLEAEIVAVCDRGVHPGAATGGHAVRRVADQERAALREAIRDLSSM